MTTKNSAITLNLHIYPHTFEYQSRILKETRSLADAGITDEVWLVGMWERGWAEEERIDDRRFIWRVRTRIGSRDSSLPVKMTRYLAWHARIFSRFRKSCVRVINCHSLPALPIGALLKSSCHAKLVYDTHEVESKTESAVGAKRLLYEKVERSLIHSVDAVITVSESISQWYKNAYGLKKVYAVRNIPHRHDEDLCQDSYLKAKFGIGDRETLYIFQGGLVPGRGIEILLDIFSKLDSNKHIVFMGFGELAGIVQQHARSYSNIHYQEAVSPDDVVKITSGADVGLCLQENVSLNHYLTIPNKFFEYILSGIPVITSDFPEMSRIVDEAGCGWKAPPNRDAWFSLISATTPLEVSLKRDKAMQYRKTIGWQEEEKVMLQAYRDLGLINSI
jgi:glycosyltransferase involved in cell wall biosynthesis